ncbi:hypothetical protein [Bacillus sp. B-jedd]|uniref:hypothetical protein n=1 Tax=Bacillus sp. B-jedd TaxID=1476857 RepID=UPI0011DD3364|nr:hypothetical protein [Bacillus sp. B-jedd]
MIKDFLSLKKAAELSAEALYPVGEQFANVFTDREWKEMKPISKHTKSYRIVKWGTAAALVFVLGMAGIVFLTDLVSSSIFSLVYIFYFYMSAIRHPGNFFILQKGIILDSKYISPSSIKEFSVEKIRRWHALYGYHSKVNNGFKLSFSFKNKLIPSSFVVIAEEKDLDEIIKLLEAQGILGKLEEEEKFAK